MRAPLKKSRFRNRDQQAKTDYMAEPELECLIEKLEVQLGDDQPQPRDLEALVSEFEKRCEPIIGDREKSRLDLAVAFMQMGLNGAAFRQLDKLQPTCGTYWEAQCLKGQFLIECQQYLEALELFKRVVATGKCPLNIRKESHYKKAQIYIRLGDQRRAAREIRELEKLEPNYRNVRELKKKVSDSKL
ncbi:MAG: hypothetical protein HY537_05370 [Deltaproteobacteria bacterium]|nr:hypothetical protein [Deltaproteobacteria bacterium]